MIRVAIIDDHVVVRAGLRYILEADPELEYVGEYGGGLGAADFVMFHNPDVVLLDVRMPDRSGIDALKDILAANPKARVVMLTTSDAEEDVFRALEEGALGYVMKESELEVISAAIRSAMAGEVYMTDEVHKIYETRKGSRGLSAREAQALKFAATGANNKEIAKEMGLSENSVKMFLKRAFFKLGASNRAEAVQLAVKRGLIEAGFTLVELLVVTVVLAVLMTMIFKLSGITDISTAKNLTISRMHRLENAISGYYATFGTYPPVKWHGKTNPFVQVDDAGTQDPDGGESRDLWGWVDKTGTHVTDPIREEDAWRQVSPACRVQPVAACFPFPKGGEYKDIVLEISASYQKIWEHKTPRTPLEKIYKYGFDDGVSDNIQRFDPYWWCTSWSELKLFRFGVMSYLLPRYLTMMRGAEDFFSKFRQWTGNNVMPRDPLTGRTFGGWDTMKRNYLDGDDESDEKERMAHIANIPSQAACARWMASLEGTVAGFYETELFGVKIVTEETTISAEKGLDELLFMPGGFQKGKLEEAYLVDTLTVQDGWEKDLYYYSPPPYQNYILWSAGPNGRTFPPWISRENLDQNANRCIGYWVNDDIINLSH